MKPEILTKLSEALTEGPSEILPSTEDLIDDLANARIDAWSSLYDESDPVMSKYGRDAWEQQVRLAADALKAEVGKAIAAVGERLTQGEFYREKA